MVAAARAVSFGYGGGAAVVDDVTLELVRGRTVALLGRNGAGKTTLVNLLLGRLAPGRGTVERAGQIGHVSQDRILDPDLTVRETFVLGRRVAGASAADARALVVGLELDSRLDDRVGTLSGGAQRRVDIALGLLGSPTLLLLDEPTVGLDPQSKLTFWAELRARAEGAAILVTTQELSDVQTWADEVCVLHGGTLHRLDRSDQGWYVARPRGVGDGQVFPTFALACAAAARLEAAAPGEVQAVRRLTIEEQFLRITGAGASDTTTARPRSLLGRS